MTDIEKNEGEEGTEIVGSLMMKFMHNKFGDGKPRIPKLNKTFLHHNAYLRLRVLLT